MADRDVGKAFITLRADESRLRGDLAAIKTRVTNSVADINRTTIAPKVDDAATQRIERRLTALRTSLGLINTTTAKPTVELQGDQLDRNIAKFKGDLAAFEAKTTQARLDVDTQPAERSLDRVMVLLKRVAAVVGTGFLLHAVENATRQVATFGVQSVAAFEQVQIAFEGIFRSKAAAGAFLGDLQQFAAKTPFEFDQLTSSAQRLVGTFGRSFRDQIIPTLATIGDVAATLGAQPAAIERVINAISQIQGKGRVQLEELNQIREALPGFNAVAAIAKGLGISVQEATAKITSGSVNAKDGIDAMLAGMREFPGAAGAMERQSITLNGRISTLKDNIQILTRAAFGPLTLAVGTIVDLFSGAATTGGALGKAAVTVNDAMTQIAHDVGPLLVPLLTTVATAFGRILTAIGPLITKALPLLTDLIEPVVQVVEVLATATDAALPILGVFVDIIGLFGDILAAFPVGVIEVLTYLLVANKVAMIASTIATQVFGGTLAGLAGPIGIAVGLLSLLFFAMQSDGPSEAQRQNEALSKAIDAVSKAATTNIVALGQDAEALRQIVKDGKLAEETYNALNSALTDLTEMDFETPIRGFSNLGEALTALGVPDDKVLQFIEAVNAAGRSKGDLPDFSGIFPTAEQARNAERAFDAFGPQGSKRLTDAALVVRTTVGEVKGVLGAAGHDAFTFGNTFRAAMEEVAKGDPVAAQILATFDKMGPSGRDAADVIASGWNPLVDVFGTTQEELDLFYTRLAAAPDLGIADFAALSTAIGALASPSERASVALKSVNESLDKLNGKKISLREAEIELQRLFDSIDGKDSIFGSTGKGKNKKVTLDLDVEVGRVNSERLAAALKTVTTAAQAEYDANGDPVKAEIQFEMGVDQLRKDFVAAGGTVQEFNDALASGEYGPNEIQFKTELNKADLVALQTAVDTIAAQSPIIGASIQADVDEGKYTEAQNKLDILAKLEAGGFLVDFSAIVDPAEAAAAEARLLKIITDAEANPATLDVVLSGTEEADHELARMTANRTLYVDVIYQGNPLTLGQVGFLRNEAGGIYRSFMAGGFSHIQNTAPHIISAAQAAQGPHFMYGEPSTHGESFISMAPKYRERSMAIWAQTGRMLGVQQVSGGGGGADIGPLVSRLDKMTSKVEKMAANMLLMPPISVVAAGGSAENAAAKIWYANKARLVDSR